MPLAFKQQKMTSKIRKPLSSSTNTRESNQKKQKSYTKKQRFKESHQKLINQPSTIIKTYILTEEQNNRKSRDDISQKNRMKQISVKRLKQMSANKQLSSKIKQSWSTKMKQSVKQMYFYDKYIKKEIINISIIEQKSLLSINQENSLDSLNNFIKQGNNQDKSLVENSHESSSFEDGDEDWSMFQKEYLEMIGQSELSEKQFDYLKMVEEIRDQQKEEKQQKSQQLIQSLINAKVQIQRLHDDIKKLKEIKNDKQNILQGSHKKAKNVIKSNGQIQSRTQEEPQSEVIQMVKIQSQDVNSPVILQNKEVNNMKTQKTKISSSRSVELKAGNTQNMRSKVSDKMGNNKYQEEGNRFEQMRKEDKRRQKQEKIKQERIITQQLLQQLSQEQNNKSEFSRQQKQLAQIQEEKLLNLQQELSQQNITQSQQNITQDQKSQEQFMRFMDKEYLDKKQLQQNQPNLSLNNISNIMKIKPIELHNKSIENYHQIKQKEDDQVVAMLQNQLRGKKSSQQRSIRPNLFLKQQNSLQLKEQNQIILKDENQIILKDDNQIILKETRDNLGLNQSDYQTNQQSELQQDPTDQNKNFFFALQARQKWILSLDKDQKWKSTQLSLLAKMKKILHNPYIQFQDD